ncbi:MAG: polysaccharide biosynthesis tyrosine autokinase [Desulfomonile tiedjei]|uniref:Polysaccharide biosynthesis tyrosine autokinase n=1 Tax=Desulfomonile tiedjei TaxID=2358 RepID=A0A9D6V3X3_9BACT|nr:polysaccharide biosynthesis tyrosine autokinase [Desulfomonile tiedjei]
MESRNPTSDDPITVTMGRDRAPVGYHPRMVSEPQSPRGTEYHDYDEEPEKTIKDYIRVIYKRKRIVAIVFLAVVALTAVYTFTRVPIYRATATLEFDKENANSINNIGESLAPNWTQAEFFATQSGILKSRSMGEALQDKLDLSNSLEFKPEDPSFTSQLINRMSSLFSPQSKPVLSSDRTKRDALAKATMDRISVKRESNSRLLNLSMDAKNPEFARKMLENYIEIYLDQNLRKRRVISQEAVAWLRGEQTKAEDKLVKSMASLVNFTNEHGIVSLEDASNHVLRFFNSTAEGLVKSKEHRVQLEALQKEGATDGLAILPSDLRQTDAQHLKEKLSLLEAEYMQMREIYSDDYPKVVMLKKQISFLKNRLAENEKVAVKAALETAKSQETLQQQAFELARKDAMNNNSLGVQYAVLKKEVETNEQIYKILLQKSKEMELNIQIIGNNISVIDPPITPVDPVKPNKALSLLIGSFLGLLGGMTAAFILEQVDNSIHTTEDIERNLNLPSLGVVPDIKKFRKLHGLNGSSSGHEFLAHNSPKAPVSEAIKNIKTSIFLSVPATSIGTLVVSSAVPQEGKTFISVSISSVLCSNSKKVLIVDADLRRPRIGKVFGQPDNIPGLTTYLTQENAKLQSILHKSKIPGLYYVAAGPLPPNPVALLESERMLEFVNKCRRVFDFVIFDSPPVAGFSDARILSNKVDGVIMVVREGAVPLEVVRQSKSMITSANGRILGVVLNMANGSSSYYGNGYRGYYRYYGHYYGSRSGSVSLTAGEQTPHRKG